MSIVLVAFEGAPSVCEEAVQKEKELDERIEQKVKGMTVFTVASFILICDLWVDYALYDQLAAT